jgi:hypothetical protein
MRSYPQEFAAEVTEDTEKCVKTSFFSVFSVADTVESGVLSR